jgi:hypothetical protein
MPIRRDSVVRERDFSELSNFARWDNSEVACFVCKNCGARPVLPRTTVATTCPYCHSSVVLDADSLGTVKPDSVIPFEVPVENAQSSILAWRKKRYFAPNSFRKKLDIDSVHGVYMPIWTFDFYTTTKYSGTLGKRKTRIVRRNGKTYTETYTDWFPVAGSQKNIFDDIKVRANSTVSDKTFRSLEPFPQPKYVVYNDAYLLGFTADNYTVEPSDALRSAEGQIRQIMQEEIRVRHGADVVGNLELKITYDARSFKYLFVPMYVATTVYNKKNFHTFVSGVDNGGKIKTTGTAPKSAPKIIALVLAILIVLSGIFALFYFFGDVEFGDVDFGKTTNQLITVGCDTHVAPQFPLTKPSNSDITI